MLNINRYPDRLVTNANLAVFCAESQGTVHQPIPSPKALQGRPSTAFDNEAPCPQWLAKRHVLLLDIATNPADKLVRANHDLPRNNAFVGGFIGNALLELRLQARTGVTAKGVGGTEHKDKHTHSSIAANSASAQRLSQDR
jgi:hypothetical protein